MYDTCIALVVDECPDAVSDESLDGFKVLDLRSRSSGLKSDEFQRCSDSMVIVKSEKELRETSVEILGSLMNGKSRPRGLAPT